MGDYNEVEISIKDAHWYQSNCMPIKSVIAMYMSLYDTTPVLMPKWTCFSLSLSF